MTARSWAIEGCILDHDHADGADCTDDGGPLYVESVTSPSFYDPTSAKDEHHV